ncbi:unnamed protein product [Phytophthora fragariaefolia]|uniref:Unnamed protein product n=1 Tax=Phytophthora fragariaefolia TaxID=1490495 RepID=A0A9W6TZY6_9STRA|nr:unnamed protein product [Phytophthora fragariaefolia]
MASPFMEANLEEMSALTAKGVFMEIPMYRKDNTVSHPVGTAALAALLHLLIFGGDINTAYLNALLGIRQYLKSIEGFPCEINGHFPSRNRTVGQSNSICCGQVDGRGEAGSLFDELSKNESEIYNRSTPTRSIVLERTAMLRVAMLQLRYRELRGGRSSSVLMLPEIGVSLQDTSAFHHATEQWSKSIQFAVVKSMGVVSGPKTRDHLLAAREDLAGHTICFDSPFEVEAACLGYSS